MVIKAMLKIGWTCHGSILELELDSLLDFGEFVGLWHTKLPGDMLIFDC